MLAIGSGVLSYAEEHAVRTGRRGIQDLGEA